MCIVKCYTGSFTYYVTTKGEGGGVRNDYATVTFPLSNAEFDYGGGDLVLDWQWLSNVWMAPMYSDVATPTHTGFFCTKLW